MILATVNVIIVYHLDSEQPRLIAKDISDVNDPAWLAVNNDPAGHAMMHLHPDEYNPLDHNALQAHHKKYIPIHKAWHKKYGHKFICQNQARDAFREHLAESV